MREATPHAKQTTRTNTIINALKRRAQAVLNDPSIDAQSRAIIRYAMEINDPWLAELVRRADVNEPLIDAIDPEQASETKKDDLTEEKIEALTELICRAGGETSSALLRVNSFTQAANGAKELGYSFVSLRLCVRINAMIYKAIAARRKQ